MAERLNAPDSKSGIPSRVSGVQIPLSPPEKQTSSGPLAEAVRTPRTNTAVKAAIVH
jgi:hypothetical protein